MTLPIAGRALGLMARRCRTDIDVGSAGAGLREVEGLHPRGARSASGRSPVAPARKRQRAAGDGGRYSTTAYLQTPCYNESVFLWGSTPVSFPQGKKCHREKFRIRGSSYRMNTVQNSVEKREAVSQDRFKGQAKPPHGYLFSPASLPLFPRSATPRRSRGGLSAASVAADITVKAPFHRAVDSSTACQG